MFSKNSTILLYAVIQSILDIAAVRTFHIPFTQVFKVSANAAKSKVEKKLLIPSAMLYPNCSKLNSLPNESAA